VTRQSATRGTGCRQRFTRALGTSNTLKDFAVTGAIVAGLTVNLAASSALGADILANPSGTWEGIISGGGILGVGIFHQMAPVTN
jgi:hypothetical protein